MEHEYDENDPVFYRRMFLLWLVSLVGFIVVVLFISGPMRIILIIQSLIAMSVIGVGLLHVRWNDYQIKKLRRRVEQLERQVEEGARDDPV